MSDQPPEPANTDIRIVGGGRPSAEQLAALVVALTPTPPSPAEETAPVREDPWRRAALIEGVGGRPPTSPADLSRLPGGG